MSAFDAMHEGLQLMGGGFAGDWGQPFDVRRLDDNTNTSISNNNPITVTSDGCQFRAWVDKASRKMIENSAFDILTFEATCNNLQLQIGDTFTQTGKYNDGSIFTLAQMRPMHETIFVRTEAGCSISRIMPTAGAADQQPISGIVETPGYGGADKGTEHFLKLQDGNYFFSTDGTIPNASVLAGLQPISRVRDGVGSLPGTGLYREDYIVWLPLMTGEMLYELDRLRFPNMDAYQVARLFSSNSVGLSGYICTIERVNV